MQAHLISKFGVKEVNSVFHRVGVLISLPQKTSVDDPHQQVIFGCTHFHSPPEDFRNLIFLKFARNRGWGW